MKSIALSSFAAISLISGTARQGCDGDDDGTPTPEPSMDCTGSYLVEEVNSYDQEPQYDDPYLAVSCDDTFVNVEGNGIPNFEFDQVTPNALRTQDYLWKIPRYPEVADAITSIYLTGPVGIAVNGLPFYAPNEAPQDNYGDPVTDGLLDYCMGHTDQAGAYHFHARPDCLFEEVDGQVHLVMAYAFDGFPVVAPFECGNASCSVVYELESSYVYVGGSDNAYEANQYVEGHGDLDECNGGYGSDGQYRYYATDTFPYLIGCFTGTPEASNNPNGAGGGGAEDACNSDADCEASCPDSAQGCACVPNPDGDMMCVQTCDADSDCPTNGDPPLTCDESMGICIPADGNP